MLGLGGLATVLGGDVPSSGGGAATAHAVAARGGVLGPRGVAGVYPAHMPSRGPAVLRPVVSVAAATEMLGLVARYGATLDTDARVGLTERPAASAQAC